MRSGLLFFFTLIIGTNCYSGLSCSNLLSSSDHTLSNGLKVPKSTIEHIMMGDYSGAQLKSGMHSFKGLSALLKKNPQIMDLDFLHPSLIQNEAPQWIHVHPDVAGASFVRLPKQVVTRQGRKGMRAASINLQGSYLWKSIFPQGFDESNLIKALEDSVGNLDLENGQRITTHHSSISFNGLTIEITVLININSRTVVTAYPSGSQSSSLLGFSKAGHFPMTRHIVTRLSNSFAIEEHDLWTSLSKNLAPHKLNDGDVLDNLSAYRNYFESDYFGLPLAEVASLLTGINHSIDPEIMVHYRRILNQMTSSTSITHSQKITFLKKAVYQIRSFGFESDALLFNLAIHNDIMRFAVKSLSDEELKDFHSFYTLSPSYWYSLFPTHVLQAYLQAGRQESLATVLGLLKHPQLFLLSEPLVLKKPLQFRSHITNELIKDPDYIQHWSSAYALRVARLKMNRLRIDLDFVQDRLNNFILISSSYQAANLRGTIKNIQGAFDSDLLQNALTIEIANAYAGISLEFGNFVPLQIGPTRFHDRTKTFVIPHYEVVEYEGQFVLKETLGTAFRESH